MGALNKRQKEALEKVSAIETVPVTEALALLKEIRGTKFDESLDVAINLGIDTKKTDQAVRGSTVCQRVLANRRESLYLQQVRLLRQQQQQERMRSVWRTLRKK